MFRRSCANAAMSCEEASKVNGKTVSTVNRIFSVTSGGLLLAEYLSNCLLSTCAAMGYRIVAYFLKKTLLLLAEGKSRTIAKLGDGWQVTCSWPRACTEPR